MCTFLTLPSIRSSVSLGRSLFEKVAQAGSEDTFGGMVGEKGNGEALPRWDYLPIGGGGLIEYKPYRYLQGLVGGKYYVKT